MESGKKLAEKSNMDAYIDVLFCANEKTFTEANAMLADTLFEICEKSGMTDRIVERMREKGLVESKEQVIEKVRTDEKLKIARNLLAEGSTPEFVQKITGLDMDAIKNIQAGQSVCQS
jgi:predicted transposase YdaD